MLQIQQQSVLLQFDCTITASAINLWNTLLNRLINVDDDDDDALLGVAARGWITKAYINFA